MQHAICRLQSPTQQTCTSRTRRCGPTQGQTDGRTDAQPMHRPCCACRAGGVCQKYALSYSRVPLDRLTDFVCDLTRPDPLGVLNDYALYKSTHSLTQTHRQCPYMSRLSGQVYDQTKSAGLVGDPSGPWVWSGLVGSVWWNVDIVQQTNRMTSLLLLRRTQASKQVTSWMIASYRDTHSMRSWRSPAKSRRLMIVRLLPCRSLQITIITHSA